MATKAQIHKLSERIEALAARRSTGSNSKVPFIIVDGVTEEEAAERHYQMHPEDRDADRKIFLHVVDPPAR